MTSMAAPFTEQHLEPLPNTKPPGLSVDRALGHFLSEVKYDPEAIVDFYTGLPHVDKPPLSELVIHLSATPVIDEDRERKQSIYGSMVWNGTKRTYKATPELPRTTTPTILIFIGTRYLEGDTSEELNEAISETISHELTHYAQGAPSNNSSRVERICTKAALGGAIAMLSVLSDRQWIKTAAAAFLATELLSDANEPTALKVALGAAAMTHVAGWKKRKRSSSTAHQLYLENDQEVNARDHETTEMKAVEVTITEDPDRELFKSIVTPSRRSMPATRFIANQVHKELSTTPAK